MLNPEKKMKARDKRGKVKRNELKKLNTSLKSVIRRVVPTTGIDMISKL